MQDKKVLILARDGITTQMLFSKLSEHYNSIEIIYEGSNAIETFKKRIKKHGFFKVFWQLAFLVTIVPFIRKKSRINDILKTYKFDLTEKKKHVFERVNNVNDRLCLKRIQEINPDLVFVNGTRIISSTILNAVDRPFINIHVGITPKYRGVHGGYWAVKTKDLEHFGTTVHLIDSGIDTGAVLDQVILEITPDDNYNTYPILQYAAGVNLLIDLIEKNPEFYLKTKPSITQESKIYSHPTIWEYLF